MGSGRLIIWILATIIATLIILYVFFPLQSYKLTTSFSQAKGRVVYKEVIPILDTCDTRGAEYVGGAFGLNTKDMINYDCKNACNKKSLTYISYGCKDNKLVCFCD